MTTQQEKAIKRIEELVRNEFYNDNYEIKKWEVTEIYKSVSLYAVWGRKGDEGTLAEAYCRDHIHLFIGLRGGITYPVFTKRGDATRRFKSICTTAYEQK